MGSADGGICDDKGIFGICADANFDPDVDNDDADVAVDGGDGPLGCDGVIGFDGALMDDTDADGADGGGIITCWGGPINSDDLGDDVDVWLDVMLE